MPRALGLDGSLQNFGIAVVEFDFGKSEINDVIQLVLSKTKKDGTSKRANDDFARFAQHFTKINELCEYWNVTHIFGEIPSGAKDARAAFAFGGVTATLAALNDRYDVTIVTPREVKLAATGFPHADKDDVILAMHDAFPDTDWITSKRPNTMDIKTKDGLYLTNANEHLADAIAVAFAGVKKL